VIFSFLVNYHLFVSWGRFDYAPIGFSHVFWPAVASDFELPILTFLCHEIWFWFRA
jgi:hypothetical protein